MKQNIKFRTVILGRLAGESLSFTLGQLKANKFRTFLSLLGVSIGIFSIVAVFMAIDSLKATVSEGLKQLDMNTINVSKWPMGAEDGSLNGEYRWWDYLKRPNITYSNYKFLEKNCTTARAVCCLVNLQGTFKYSGNSYSSGLAAVSYNWDKLADVKIDRGRYFTQSECNAASPVMILGPVMARHLFGDLDPINRKVKFKGHEFNVIGIFKESGDNMVNMVNLDGGAMITIDYGLNFIDRNNTDIEVLIQPEEGTDKEMLIGQLKTLMRGLRRLGPEEKDNFSINKFSFISDSIDKAFASLNLAGWILAGFSLLIGGFGIINIMYVSVKERTKMIGIQKALGAHKMFILAQFLFEAVLLALNGGILGIIFAVAIALAIPTDKIVISASTIFSGLAIAVIIGIISGMLPAMKAASLNPVDAINDK